MLQHMILTLICPEIVMKSQQTSMTLTRKRRTRRQLLNLKNLKVSCLLIYFTSSAVVYRAVYLSAGSALCSDDYVLLFEGLPSKHAEIYMGNNLNTDKAMKEEAVYIAFP